MAYCGSGWVFLVLLLHGYLLMFPSPVLSDNHNALDQEEKNLLDGLNNYRTTHNLPALYEVDSATCLADKIATRFQDSQQCFALPSQGNFAIQAGSGANQISDYYRLLSDCDLDVDNTKDGVILPACVGDLHNDLTYVIANFTETGYASYLRDSDYTGAGVGSEGLWVVVVMTTNSDGGNFSGGRRSVVFLVGELLVVIGLVVLGLFVV